MSTADKINRLSDQVALRNTLQKDASWKELFVDNLQKAAAGKALGESFVDTAKRFVTNPAGGEGVKGAAKQIAGTTGAMLPTAAGSLAGTKLYEYSDAKSPISSTLTALFTPWLFKDVKNTAKRVAKGVKEGDVGRYDYMNEFSSGLVKPTLVKGAVGATGGLMDWGMNKGPQMASKAEEAIDYIHESGKNIAGVTQQANRRDADDKGYLDKALAPVGDTFEEVQDIFKYIKNQYGGRDVNSVLLPFKNQVDIISGSADRMEKIKGNLPNLEPSSPEYAEAQKELQTYTKVINKQVAEIQQGLIESESNDPTKRSATLQENLDRVRKLAPGAKTEELNETLNRLKEESKGSTLDSDLIEDVKKAAKGTAKASTNLSEFTGHLKQHWGKYALGAGGIAAIYAIAKYRKSVEEEEEEKEEKKFREKELRALNRLARTRG